MIPGVVMMIPNFQVMVSLGFLNSYHGLIIPAAFSAFGTFLLRQFMLSIPTSLDEAARIDGAGHWVQQEQPGEVNRLLLDFLRQLDGA